jgi:hypothetical protein
MTAKASFQETQSTCCFRFLRLATSYSRRI